MRDEEEEQNSPPPFTASAAANPHDGLIDFRHYSLAQLRELTFGIDPHVSPCDHANLQKELQRRQEQESASAAWLTGRFSRADGLRGWLQAKSRRAPLYGAGAIALQGDALLLRGRRRTWLGAAEDAELQLPLAKIRNVAHEAAHLRWQFHRRAAWRSIEFVGDDAVAVAGLVKRLPADQTPAFQDLETFNRRLNSVAEGTWITRLLVLANIGVFSLMAFQARSLGPFDFQHLVAFGANYGPLTIGGQWWRLLTALFVHVNLAHVLLNMWALWGSGRLTERLYGRWFFAFIYLASGLCASLTSLMWDPARVSAGASGAVFGVLGAFLACLARQRRTTPPTILRTHWISTSAFVLFNLLNGAVQAGIDNAAHIGGLLSGFVLGCLLIRPLDPEERLRGSRERWSAALAVTAAVAAVALLQLGGRASKLTGFEAFMRSHDWYLRGEAGNLRTWQDLAGRAAAGTISDAGLGSAFAQQIVPFWQDTAHRLQQEQAATPPEQRRAAALLGEFVRLRLEWANSIVTATISHDKNDISRVFTLAQETDAAQARFERVALRTAMDRRALTAAYGRWFAGLRHYLAPASCVHAPPGFGPRAPPADAPGDGPARRAAAACRAQSLFLADDFTTLDAWLTQASSSIADLPDGGSTLQGIHSGLADLFEFGALQPNDVLLRTAQWRLASSSPQWADTAEAEFFLRWGWNARGHGAAKDVSQQAMALFAHRIAMAAAGLEELRQHGQQSPLWYALALNIGLDRDLGIETLHGIFQEGAQRSPQYFPLYRGMLRSLMPRWGGSYDQVNGFIRERTMRSSAGAIADPALYARLYWMYSDLEGDNTNVFTDGEATWSGMKEGFRHLLRHHQDSDVILNAFARFACVANDSQEYQQLRPLLEKRRSTVAWTAKTTIQYCDSAMRAPVAAAR